MKNKRTLIRNIVRVVSFDPMAQIVKAEYQHKDQSLSNEIKPIDATTMLESIEALGDNVVFSDVVEWTYKKVSDTSDTGDFVIYGDSHDSMVGTIVVMYLKVVDGYIAEDVENELNKTIFNQ